MRAWAWILMVACGPAADDLDDPGWDGWDDAEGSSRVPVRIATWNVQELGEEGTSGWEAVRDVLARIDADVVALNEIEAFEDAALAALGAELGYAVVEGPLNQPFGTLGNAVLSRWTAQLVEQPEASVLSGDPGANDQTRLPVVITVQIPGTDAELTVVGQHFKSGFDEVDAFRRAADAARTAQAAIQLGGSSDYLVVLGDVNVEAQDSPGIPASWTTPPSDLPSGYELGDDFAAQLGDGFGNDPFQRLTSVGLTPIDAVQRDGDPATRPISGRRIDRVFVSEPVRTSGLAAEVYDSEDDALGIEGLADAGSAPAANACARGSDHLPVVVEFRIRDE